ncbi:MAG: DUF2442 domain-containing protein, partial [Candidatus Riflebacteria bacterium]
MNTMGNIIKAIYRDGQIIIQMEEGLEIRFPVKENKRLAAGTPAQLNNIEISPFGLHWPDLDEDLSFKGMIKGDFGQHISEKPATLKR